MRFEVGALRVGFPTTDVVARVCGNSLPRPGAPTAFRLGFLRQAVPTGDHEGLCRINRPQSADSTPRPDDRIEKAFKSPLRRPGQLLGFKENKGCIFVAVNSEIHADVATNHMSLAVEMTAC